VLLPEGVRPGAWLLFAGNFSSQSCQLRLVILHCLLPVLWNRESFALNHMQK
jgi:hypothetical protein